MLLSADCPQKLLGAIFYLMLHMRHIQILTIFKKIICVKKHATIKLLNLFSTITDNIENIVKRDDSNFAIFKFFFHKFDLSRNSSFHTVETCKSCLFMHRRLNGLLHASRNIQTKDYWLSYFYRLWISLQGQSKLIGFFRLFQRQIDFIFNVRWRLYNIHHLFRFRNLAFM